MSMQDLFDRAITGVKQQGCLSLCPDNGGEADTGGCYYRYPDNPNVRCAVGHLIPDNLYRPDMEGVGVGALLEENPHIAAAIGVTFPSDSVDLLADLQCAHDFSRDMPGFLREAASVALKYGLKSDMCEEN